MISLFPISKINTSECYEYNCEGLLSVHVYCGNVGFYVFSRKNAKTIQSPGAPHKTVLKSLLFSYQLFIHPAQTLFFLLHPDSHLHFFLTQ